MVVVLEEEKNQCLLVDLLDEIEENDEVLS